MRGSRAERIAGGWPVGAAVAAGVLLAAAGAVRAGYLVDPAAVAMQEGGLGARAMLAVAGLLVLSGAMGGAARERGGAWTLALGVMVMLAGVAMYETPGRSVKGWVRLEGEAGVRRVYDIRERAVYLQVAGMSAGWYGLPGLPTRGAHGAGDEGLSGKGLSGIRPTVRIGERAPGTAGGGTAGAGTAAGGNEVAVGVFFGMSGELVLDVVGYRREPGGNEEVDIRVGVGPVWGEVVKVRWERNPEAEGSGVTVMAGEGPRAVAVRLAFGGVRRELPVGLGVSGGEGDGRGREVLVSWGAAGTGLVAGTGVDRVRIGQGGRAVFHLGGEGLAVPVRGEAWVVQVMPGGRWAWVSNWPGLWAVAGGGVLAVAGMGWTVLAWRRGEMGRRSRAE